MHRVVTVPIVERSPEAVIDYWQNTIKEIKTAHYTISSEVILHNNDVETKIRSYGDFDGGLNQTLLGSLELKNVFELQGLGYLMNIQTRFTDDKKYFNFTETPAFTFLDLSAIKGKWYEFKAWPTIDQVIEAAKLLQQTATATNYLTVIKRLPDSVIDDQLMYHYTAECNTSEIKGFISLLQKSNSSINLGSLDLLNDIDIELWINKKNKYLHRIEFKYMKKDTIATITVDISDFNETVQVEQPVETQSLFQFGRIFFNETNIMDLPLFGYLIGLDTSDQLADEDADDLPLLWEQVFGTDPEKADTDNDGYTDLAEIRNGYNPSGEGKLFSQP